MEQKDKNTIWRETIALMEKATVNVNEKDRAAYEQKIMQKLKSGRKLTSDEMEYLRVYQPELYRSACRVENARKVLKTKLKSCKSKQEVQNVISVQQEYLKALDGTDKEYMTAMVQRECQEFKKTSEYARLPETTKQEKRREKKIVFGGESGDEEAGYDRNRVALLGYSQIQCDTITQMAQAFTA